MLGYYNYTVILTYTSLILSIIGIFAGISGDGHPFIATVCLMMCGLCDAFDGMVARTRKESTEAEKKFGIQIDSLTDLIAFGVLPCAICYGIHISHNSPAKDKGDLIAILRAFESYKVQIYVVIFTLFVLAALIRLANYNVQEEIRQKATDEKRTEYEGLPVTSSAIIFPIVVLIQFIYGKRVDLSPIYVVTMLITGFLFLSRIRIKKLGFREILVIIALSIIEFAFILFYALEYNHVT